MLLLVLLLLLLVLLLVLLVRLRLLLMLSLSLLSLLLCYVCCVVYIQQMCRFGFCSRRNPQNSEVLLSVSKVNPYTACIRMEYWGWMSRRRWKRSHSLDTPPQHERNIRIGKGYQPSHQPSCRSRVRTFGF